MAVTYVNVDLKVNLDTGAVDFTENSGRPCDCKDDGLFSIGAHSVLYMGNKYSKREDVVLRREEGLVRRLSYSLIP